MFMELKRSDVAKYVGAILINFPNAFNANTDTDKYLLIETWYAALRKYPKEIVSHVVMDVIAHSEYAPKLGSVINCIERLQDIASDSAETLWAILIKAVRAADKLKYSFCDTFKDEKGLTGKDRAILALGNLWSELPEELKQYLGNKAELMRLTDAELDYEKGRFFKALPAIKERIALQRRLPTEVHEMSKRLSEQFSLNKNKALKSI